MFGLPESHFNYDDSRAERIGKRDLYIQPVDINTPDGICQEYIITKDFPKSIGSAPHRISINAIKFLPNYRYTAPRDFVQYTIMTREQFDRTLSNANAYMRNKYLSTPDLPENFDQIDEQSIKRVRRLISGGFDNIVYFHPVEKYYYCPANSRTQLFDKLGFVEIISIANQLPVYPTVTGINSAKKYEYNPEHKVYLIKDVSLSNEPMMGSLYEYASLLNNNPTVYNRMEGRRN